MAVDSQSSSKMQLMLYLIKIHINMLLENPLPTIKCIKVVLLQMEVVMGEAIVSSPAKS